MKRRNKIIISIVLLIAGFIGLNYYIPIYICYYMGNKCRLCHVTRSEKIIYVYHIPVYRKTSKTQRTDYTDLYDKYIAEPHKHQWSGGGCSRHTKFLFKRGGVRSCGFHSGKYHFLQLKISNELLSLMELLEHESQSFRREIFHGLIECNNPNDYEFISELIEKIRSDPQNACELYEIYKQQKSSSSGQMTERDCTDLGYKYNTKQRSFSRFSSLDTEGSKIFNIIQKY